MVADIAEIKGLMEARPKFLPGARSADSDEAPTFSLGKLSVNGETVNLSVTELLPKVASIVGRVGRQEPVFGCLVPPGVKGLVERMSAAM